MIIKTNPASQWSWSCKEFSNSSSVNKSTTFVWRLTCIRNEIKASCVCTMPFGISRKFLRMLRKMSRYCFRLPFMALPKSFASWNSDTNFFVQSWGWQQIEGPLGRWSQKVVRHFKSVIRSNNHIIYTQDVTILVVNIWMENVIDLQMLRDPILDACNSDV